MNTLELIKNIRAICFYGLGRENISLINYLAKNKLISEIVYCDQRPYLEKLPLPSSFIAQELVADYDLIFKAPGVSLYQEHLQLAIRKGIPVLSPNQIFFDQNHAFKVCVTGSKGKSTFCKLLAELLEASGLKVLLAGNIGRPLMDLIDDPAEVAVIELSSYQLASLQIKPDVAVLTSIFPEHLSWHLTLEQYYQDKLRIALEASKFFVFNESTANFLKQQEVNYQFQQINLSVDNREIKLDKDLVLKIRNPYFYPEHLQATLQGTIGVLQYLASVFQLNWKGAFPKLQSVIDSFQGLPHRLEVFYDKENFLAVDDSISTAPEAVVAALKAFPDYEINLFLGGYSKGTSQEVIINYLNNHPDVNVYCYSITGKTIFEQLTVTNKAYLANLEAAIKLAWEKMQGRFIKDKQLFLLSPGAASFDQFRDFEDRGQQFKKMLLPYFLN